MAESFGWGLLAASSLVLGSLIALRFRIKPIVLGLVMAFGVGVLISAVAFDLVEEAAAKTNDSSGVALGLFAGCTVFFFGDLLIDRMGGANRKRIAHGARNAEAESGPAIVLGTVLDGIPESMVLGLTILESGSVGAAFLAAVFISNLPEGIAGTAGLRSGGWRTAGILGLWVGVALVSAVASATGYVVLDDASPGVVGFVLAFAGGAILTMLADTMAPEAYQHGGKLAGVLTTLGFAVAFAIHAAR